MNDRAPRLSPEDRRLSLVEAATELIRATGAMPTTRAVAQAVGIAEGTVFRAFENKEALIEAVIGAAVCPAPFRARIDAIDPTLPLPERLAAGATLLMSRFATIAEVVGPLGVMGQPVHHAHPHCPDPDAAVTGIGGHMSSLARLVEPDAHRLRFDVADVVQAVRMLAFAGSHAHLAEGALSETERIVDLVLHGSLVDPGRSGSPRTTDHRIDPDQGSTPC